MSENSMNCITDCKDKQNRYTMKCATACNSGTEYECQKQCNVTTFSIMNGEKNLKLQTKCFNACKKLNE